MQFVVMLYKRFGYYFVEAYHGVAAVGGLGAATQIASPVNAIASALAISVNPYAASLTAGRQLDELSRFFRSVLGKALIVLVPISTITALLADPVARALNPEYLDAAAAYRWLTFAVIWMFICQVSTAVLIGMGYGRLMAIIVTVDLIAYTGLAYWLVPIYGPEGAAMATFFQEMLNAGMQVGCVLWVMKRPGGSAPHGPEESE
jgi:O-antigen/teichoic acid export membrane protein